MAFFYNQLVLRLPYPTADHTGETIIVTGANIGLGLEAARHFTRLNAEKVILGVRNVEKGETAKKSIEETEKRQGVVEVWQLDLSSYESTKQFARRAEGLKRLDTLLENAGIATSIYSVTEDNESTITTNVVSTFLLGLLLLPKLRESSAKYNTTPHLSIVSSEVHGWTQFPERNTPDIFKTLNDKETANMAERHACPSHTFPSSTPFPYPITNEQKQNRYPMSKLLEVLFVRALAPRSKTSGKPDVIINYTTPGLCHSQLARNAPLYLHVMKFFLARSTEHGSRALVNAAEGGSETHGQYLENCKMSQ